MENNFKKVRTGKDLAISLTLIAAGIGLFFLNKGTGITVGSCGIICLLAMKTGYKLDGKGKVFSKKSREISRCCRASVLDFLDGKNDEPVVQKGSEGGSVRLEVYFNKSLDTAYAQLSDFSNLTYQPATGLVELDGRRAGKLLDCI